MTDKEDNNCPICKQPMCGVTGRADPDIDPDKVWDTVYYCPECINKEMPVDGELQQ